MTENEREAAQRKPDEAETGKTERQTVRQAA